VHEQGVGFVHFGCGLMIQTAQSNDVAQFGNIESFLEKPFLEKRKIVARKVTRLLPDRIQLSRRYQQDENGLRLTSVSG
jgi:hypothetical protein